MKFLIDEQLSTRIAAALREKGIEATSVHGLGRAHQGFSDEDLLELATSRQETLVTVDDDFLETHARWMKEGKSHCGIIWGLARKYQRIGAIGLVVQYCKEWSDLIVAGAGTLNKDVYNQILYIDK